jgi:heat shock protein HslJ
MKTSTLFIIILFIVSFGSCSVPQYPIINIWRLYELKGESVPPGKGFTDDVEIIFESNNRISGFGGCNELYGGYEKNLFDLSFKISSSHRNCDDNMVTENNFIDVLNSVNRYEMPDEFELHLYKDSTLLAKLKGTIIY